MSLTLSAVAELAVKYVNTTNRHVFLTGKAGSGKTTLLKYIVERTYKNAVVAAPTGIAAINASGVTLHSLLQLPFGTFIPDNINFNAHEFNDRVNTPHSVLSQLQMSASKRQLLKEIELLIIDEVSMLRADLLDCIDLILRTVRRRKNLPFGGVQVLFIGDLNQLPPVVKNAEKPLLAQFYSSAYFFDARVLRETPPVFVELDKIYRQSDQEFVDILNRLRDNELLSEDISTLNSHYKKGFSPAPEDGYIHITTHNRKSDVINQKELGKLSTNPYNYHAVVTGDFPENMYPLPEMLVFKEGAQVMFIKNDPSGEGQFFNGKIGHIISLSRDHIDVKLTDPDKVVHVSTHVWENKRYKVNSANNEIEENVIGSFEQYPLKLAWAITVHKSQGLTFEKAILDLTDSFAPGQMYVALSRLTSMKGLVLSTPIPDVDFDLDTSLADFASTKKEYDSLQKDLKNDSKEFLVSFIQNSFNFSELISDLSYHINGFNKAENRSIKQQYLGWTREVLDEIKSLQLIAEKFFVQVRNIGIKHPTDYLHLLNERVEKAEAYFYPLISALAEKIKAHKKELGNKQQVKTYTKELKGFEEMFKRQVLQIKKAQLLIKYAAENKVPTKRELHPTINVVGLNSPAKKEKKSPTRDISLQMYKEGNSIEDIALKRGLSRNTIEGHLSTFVANGGLSATNFVELEKIEQILTVAKTLDTTLLNQIKERLGDDFSYGDIKMAMAHKKSLEEKVDEKS